MAHLTSLPPEILYTIFTFLEPAHAPSQPLTLVAVSATSKHMNTLVEEHAKNALKTHGRPLPKRLGKLNTLRRKWLRDLCQFCCNASKRRACFYSQVVCCKHCDRAIFPKMTMTHAISSYHLSKLDLFTPNALHPHLPSLRVGAASVMGAQATMISEPDVLARRDHIYTLLGDKVHKPVFLRIRPGAHTRIIEHLGIGFDPVRNRWRRTPSKPPDSESTSADAQAREGERVAYVQKALAWECAVMGIDGQHLGAGNGV